MHVPSLVLLGIVLTAQAAHAEDVTVTVSPKQPLIETTRTGQSLSFDLILKNPTAKPLSISEIRLAVFDASGALMSRKLAGSGIDAAFPSNASIPPKGTLLVLNPFHTFAPGMPLARLDFELWLEAPDGTKYVVPVSVAPRAFTPKTKLVLPVRGRVIIQEGHDYYAHHRRVDLTNPVVAKLGVTTNPTRYSYDFCGVDARGAMVKTDGKTNEDWVGFGAQVVAPAAGVVKEARGDVADNILGKQMFDFQLVFKDIRAFYGNYVIVDHGNGELSLLAHLRNGSVKVVAGDKVRAGQPLAQIGISGDADIPHLHYQLQDGTQLNNESLPSYFTKLTWWRGKTSSVVTSSIPDSGDIVESR